MCASFSFQTERRVYGDRLPRHVLETLAEFEDVDASPEAIEDRRSNRRSSLLSMLNVGCGCRILATKPSAIEGEKMKLTSQISRTLVDVRSCISSTAESRVHLSMSNVGDVLYPALGEVGAFPRSAQRSVRQEPTSNSAGRKR